MSRETVLGDPDNLLAITLGDKVQHVLTGVTGAVIGIAVYLFRSPRILIQPGMPTGTPMSDSDFEFGLGYREPIWFEEASLRVIERATGSFPYSSPSETT